MNKVKKNQNIIYVFIIFLTSFILGIASALYISNISNKTMLKSDNTYVLDKFDLDLSKYIEVYNLIKLYNFNSEPLNKSDLIDSSIKGLVEGLGDKNSEFMTLDETEEFDNILSGDFEGIGAVVEKNELGVSIDRIIKGSPAKKYGLKSGDIIIKANESILEGMELFDAVEKIKGPAGTKVILDIIRVGKNNILTIEVTRDKIKIPSVESEIFDEDIVYISINMFGEDTAEEFKKALYKNIDKKGLIIDLRDNGGGYLQSAVSILDNLIEDDKILVVTKYKDLFSNVSYRSINNGNIYKGKIIVLINENSASASEITAGALKDYKKAILVGQKSYGKGSVQKPFYLKDGSMVKLTIAKWFTPSDINIDHEGIMPDIEVDFKEEDYTPEEGKEDEFEFYDRQLEIAKEVLKIFIKNDAYKLSIDKSLEKLNEK